MYKHYPPTHQGTEFHCAHCNVFTGQQWGPGNTVLNRAGHEVKGLTVCRCVHCSKCSLWYAGQMLYPDSGSAALAHEDMPADFKADYDEARERDRRQIATWCGWAAQTGVPHTSIIRYARRCNGSNQQCHLRRPI
jgi:hypothetical protein